MSPPAEKARVPAPVTTMQPIWSSRSSSLTASCNSPDSRRFIALSLSGRFKVTIPTPSARSTRICSYAIISSDAGRQLSRCRGAPPSEATAGSRHWRCRHPAAIRSGCNRRLVHVVAGQRDRIDGLGQLHLKDQMAGAPERDLGAGQVHLPHPAEALVIDRAQAGAVLIE